MIGTVVITPDSPALLLGILAVTSGIAILVLLWKGGAAGTLRALAIVFLFALILRPTILSETRNALPNIVLIVKDLSASNTLGQRDRAQEIASTSLISALGRFEDLKIEEISVTGSRSTRLFETINTGLSGIPRGQLAGVIALTDGRASDTAAGPGALPGDVPFHHFQTAHQNERDRRISIIKAPQFGILNESVVIDFIVEDFGPPLPPAAAKSAAPIVTMLINGQEIARQTIPSGQKFSLTAPLNTPGQSFLELRVSSLGEELTRHNNKAITEISVIQDRLRVLLVSGEPHAGERIWRTLLKSDPAVDLVHFTILKPVNKQTVAANDELSLIPFPENELFIEKLEEFDVLIFDRYTYRGVLTDIHFDSIASYIKSGGAVLISSGPEFMSRDSLAQRRYLSDILPVIPSSALVEIPFRPRLNETGSRHPITRDIGDTAQWGRWMRLIGGEIRSGNVLMTGPGGRPLLVTDRIGDGRVAMLMSDHIWLWARGFDGGGPHRALLRRLVHWLMKEPELEEEALRLSVESRRDEDEARLTLTRQSLQTDIANPLLTDPEGNRQKISLDNISPGIWRATLPVDQDGLYTAYSDKKNAPPLRASLYVGESAGDELDEVTGTQVHLENFTQSSGGGSFLIRRDADTADVALPSIKYVKLNARKAQSGLGRGWAGLVDRQASETTARLAHPLLPPWAWFCLLIVIISGAWILESRSWHKVNK